MRKKTGSIQRRGDSWRIAYYDVNHIRQYETWATEEDAHRELAKRLAEISQGIPVTSKPQTVLFGELCADVITDYRVNGLRSIDDMEARIRLHIEPAFGMRKAAQITTAQLKSYIELRMKEGAKSGTIAREMEAIKRAFRLAMIGKKLLVMPHIPKVKENNVRAGFFSREEVERLCSHLKEPYSSFVLFGFLTGWRYSEIQGLQWRNVDFAAGEIRLDPGTTKNGDARVFPLTGELRALLLKQVTVALGKPAKAPTLMVIPLAMSAPRAGVVFQNNGRPVTDFRRSFRTACIKVGLCIRRIDGTVERVTRMFHDLRRSAAREMENQGVPRSTIKELMGHKTDSMFSRYRIVSGDDKRRAAEIIDGARNHTASSKADDGSGSRFSPFGENT